MLSLRINKKKNFIITLGLCILLLNRFKLVSWASESKDIFVGPGKTYTSIQAAINVANSGDIINVARDIYRENIVIDKDIILKGEKGLNEYNLEEYPTIDGIGGGTGILFKKDTKATIEGFIIKNGSEGGIYCESSFSTITNCTITQNKNSGVHCENSSPIIVNNMASFI